MLQIRKWQKGKKSVGDADNKSLQCVPSGRVSNNGPFVRPPQPAFCPHGKKRGRVWYLYIYPRWPPTTCYWNRNWNRKFKSENVKGEVWKYISYLPPVTPNNMLLKEKPTTAHKLLPLPSTPTILVKKSDIYGAVNILRKQLRINSIKGLSF